MKTLLNIIVALSTISSLFSQNFLGGDADGFSSSNYNESLNIYAGGDADGFASNSYNESLNIFAGGNADGFASSNYNESLNIYGGGDADGFASNNYNETLNIFVGGDADGFAFNSFNETLNIFTGGDADGFASSNYNESLNIFTGGDADGFAFNSFNESLNIFAGGDADGFAFSNYLENLNIFAGGDADGFAMYFLNINPSCSDNVTVWDGSSWSNGLPDITTQVIFSNDYITGVNGDLDLCTGLISSLNLVNISESTYINVMNDFTVNGNLIIEHEGSFVQVNDLSTVTNNGTIQVKKITPILTDRDFTILGSSMTSETVAGVYSEAAFVRYHNTNLFTPNPDVATADPGAEIFADDNGDNWQSQTGNLTVGEGYLVKPFVVNSTGGSYTTTYSQGTLNNGIVNFTTIFGDDQNDSPNILANPYASAIDAHQFITDNSSIVDKVYFWEHLTQPNINYPGYNSSNYDMGDISMYNLSGGVAASNGGNIPTQFIPSGQGFGIKAITSGTVIFDNSMRVTNPNIGYRNTDNINRMYVNINNETYGLKSTSLIAFSSEATDGFDTGFDAKRLATPISIFSIAAGYELVIQGRSTFNENQIIPIGFRTQVEELQEYTFSLGLIEGEEISNATIYLQDNLLHTVTNLSETNYSFTSEEGNFSNRFLIYFREGTLGLNEVTNNTVSLYPNPVANQLTISSISKVSKISIFDLSGRLIRVINANEQTNLTIDLSQLSSATYLIKVENQKGSITKKIIKE